jgi:CRP-like cAMP-binding protein
MGESVENKLNHFFSKYNLVSYAKGDTIINAEDVPDGVYYLIQGFVRLYSLSEDGKELTLNIFKPGSYFPVFWALADVPNVYFFEAITPVNVRRAPRQKVLEFAKSDTEILYELTKRLLVGFGGLMVRFEYLLRSDAAKKVASVFLLSARRFGKKNGGSGYVITLPMTHQDIANLAGLTRETTSLEVKKLERAGLISRKNRLWIVNNITKIKERSLLYLDEKPLPYTF